MENNNSQLTESFGFNFLVNSIKCIDNWLVSNIAIVAIITQVNWKIFFSLLHLTQIDFKLSLILHLLTCGQPQTDSKTLALIVILSIRHVVHILSSPSQLFEYHPQTALRLLGIDQHASRFDCLLLILNIYKALSNFDRQISHKLCVIETKTITNNTFLLKIPRACARLVDLF